MAIPMPDRAAGRLILVIDDDALVLEAMGGLLKSWGCEVMAVSSTREALAATAAHTRLPDLIISDYRLADGTTGFDAISQLRKAVGVPVSAFLISGDTAPERLREANISGYPLLHKPVMPMTLRAVVTQLLKESDSGKAKKSATLRSPTALQYAAAPIPALPPQ
jgi:CheY-like chemotaxis protein